MVIAGIVSCSKPAPKSTEHNDPFPVKYENELFSIEMPKGWICDSSGWKGLDSLQNTVEIFDPNGNVVWFHFVKTFWPFKWKDIDEAKEMAKSARAISGDNTELIHEVDSVEVGGYPTSILYFANYVDNDTIIQKQYVTYIQKTHTLLYLNENFLYHNWEKGQRLGDELMDNLIIKDVKNPIDKKYNKQDSSKPKKGK